jgi:hypothetical protein
MDSQNGIAHLLLTPIKTKGGDDHVLKRNQSCLTKQDVNLPKKKTRLEALLYCRDCNHIGEQDHEATSSYPWERVMKCSNPCCTNIDSWSVCKLCMNSRLQMTSWRQVKNHYHAYHNASPKKDDDDDSEEDLVHDDANDLDEINQNSIEIRPSPSPRTDCSVDDDKDADKKVDFSLDYFDRQATREYFSGSAGSQANAQRFLVAKYVLNEESLTERLSEQEARWTIELARFVNKQSRQDRQHLSYLLSEMEIMCRQDERFLSNGRSDGGNEIEQRGLLFDLPTSDNSLRSLVRVDTNKSLAKNLPHPAVEKIGDHSYVSITQIIREVLAYGYDFEDMAEGKCGDDDKVRNIGESECARQIQAAAQNPTNPWRVDLSVGLTDFSDDYNPNNSAKTAKSIWVKTVTICPDPKQRNQLTHTYPISFGPKGSDHDIVERMFQEELQDLQKGSLMYLEKYGKYVMVSVKLVATLMDQPERRNRNKVVAGNAKYGARFGYSCDFMHLKERLPSCKQCAELLSHGE